VAGETVAFRVPGQPIGKGRPRFGNGRAYTPATTAKAERAAAAIASDAMMDAGLDPFTGPVSVVIVARYRIPPSWTKKKQTAARSHEIQPGKPDLDNVVKLILDACNGVTFEDDAQVVMLEAIKTFSDEPGVHVLVRKEGGP